ncbi:hypothetical protein AI46_30100 [Burkholderia multivorans R-20526]|nr:hypothetical protein AI46_30100 [Burkholderia multivorans R-20526]
MSVGSFIAVSILMQPIFTSRCIPTTLQNSFPRSLNTFDYLMDQSSSLMTTASRMLERPHVSEDTRTLLK